MHPKKTLLRSVAALALAAAALVGAHGTAGADETWPAVPNTWQRIAQYTDTSTTDGSWSRLASSYRSYRAICKASSDGFAVFEYKRSFPTGGESYIRTRTRWESPVWGGYEVGQQFRFTAGMVGGGSANSMTCFLWGTTQRL